MTKIKLCGLSRICDIEVANKLKPEYVGLVFAKKSKRYITREKAAELKKLLSKDIEAVGVFVNEAPDAVAKLLNDDVIDIAQLHGKEDEAYVEQLRNLTDKALIKAFSMDGDVDYDKIENCRADYILLDAKEGGSGDAFDWKKLAKIKRPYFLAGGLSSYNIEDAIEKVSPFAVDVSSGIETDGFKDEEKMTEFVRLVRSK